MSPRALAASALLLAACATTAPPPSPPPRVRHLLPRSSVSAVLGQRGDLGLDDAEVRRLEEIEGELERAQAAATPGVPRGGGDAPARAPASPPGGAAPPGGERGAGRHRPSADHLEAGRAASDPYAAADRLDTAAYLRAEAALRPEHREPARAIAERYREELYDDRAAHAAPPKRP